MGMVPIPFTAMRGYVDEYIGGDPREVERLRDRLTSGPTRDPDQIAIRRAYRKAFMKLIDRDQFIRIMRTIDNWYCRQQADKAAAQSKKGKPSSR